MHNEFDYLMESNNLRKRRKKVYWQCIIAFQKITTSRYRAVCLLASRKNLLQTDRVKYGGSILSVKSPSNISPNPSKVISELSEPSDSF